MSDDHFTTDEFDTFVQITVEQARHLIFLLQKELGHTIINSDNEGEILNAIALLRKAIDDLL